MSYCGNKKLSILYILEILKDYSDENHLLSQTEIVKKLNSIYGMECERKSVGANIDNLIDYGFDIIKTQTGCYLGAREFEPSEIQFLIDAVFSSKSIDSFHSKELASKLSAFLSKYQRKQYNYLYKAGELNRTDNKQLFYNIDIINESTVIVFVEQDVNKVELYKTIEKYGVVCNFEKLKQIQIIKRLKSICNGYKVNVDENVLMYLTETSRNRYAKFNK